jgi:hypothetical protein
MKTRFPLAALGLVFLGGALCAAPSVGWTAGSGAAQSPAPPADRPRYEDFEKKPPVLGEAEFRRIEQEVLARCHLASDTGWDAAPWYYYYELGLEMVRQGDNPRSLDAFIEAAHRRRLPQRQARIYGMWFVDYLPYLHIALAHARLGNQECARDALKVAQRLGEQAERTKEYAELKQLLR